MTKRAYEGFTGNVGNQLSGGVDTHELKGRFYHWTRSLSSELLVVFQMPPMPKIIIMEYGRNGNIVGIAKCFVFQHVTCRHVLLICLDLNNGPAHLGLWHDH